VGPRAGLGGFGKSRSTGIRSPDRPARSDALYRLSYPGPPNINDVYVKVKVKLSLSTPCRYTGAVDSFLISALDEDVWSASRPSRLNTGK
jgi:hypothetical protein